MTTADPKADGETMISLTPDQLQAIGASGNVLVVASAGTGKTHTLVERCCRLLLEEGCPLEAVLMVTFTEAAAAEMRARIRERLLATLARQPANRALEEQIAQLDTAHISTLHSFCLRLAREHFHELGLDPQLTVLPDEQVHHLREETLDGLLEEHYGGTTDFSRAVRRLVEKLVQGEDRRLRALIWRVHRHAQSLPAPHRWFDLQSARFAEPEPAEWRAWLVEGFTHWRAQWLPELERFQETLNVQTCLAALAALPATPTFGQAAEALAKIQEARERKWPTGTVGKVRDQLKEFFDDAAFLEALARVDKSDGEHRPDGAAAAEPLAEDWEWVRGHMMTLVELTRQFGERFAAAKRELAGVDFADLEQLALRLLLDPQTGAPTPLAEEWRRRLRYVFVDEYQDINAAQDAILRALSREGAAANRFLVGDEKQSIYRFRLANPRIFQRYKETWRRNPVEGRTLPLAENFRSREALLDFVNAVFASLLQETLGGVRYEADAHLRFGAPAERRPLSRAADAAPRVEVHLLLRNAEANGESGAPEGGSAGPAGGDVGELETTEQEARLIAHCMRALRNARHQVWDKDEQRFRDAQWQDMVVLLRAPANKVESFAKEFSRAGVPLLAERGGLYGATEISDLLSLLRLLDNPLQDIPLLAVLRSPLVGLTLEELVAVRLARRDGGLWAALRKFHREGDNGVPKPDPTWSAAVQSARAKVCSFLTSFDVWRRAARQAALSELLERIVDETQYAALVLAQPRGEQRWANVRRLLGLARRFDPWRREGLRRFLKFVEAQQAAGAEEPPAPPRAQDAVRLLSIHQSKGLEFPIVAVADLGKPFNFDELRAPVLLDERYGLCPRVTPPLQDGHYPSLPLWLARRRQRRETLGEELRLLYVALTRARDTLLLVGTASEKTARQTWPALEDPGGWSEARRARARSALDWLGPWLAARVGPEVWKEQTSGENHLFRWFVHSEQISDLTCQSSDTAAALGETRRIDAASPAALAELRTRLAWQYPYQAATREAAKASVSVLRRRFVDETDDEARPWQRPPGTRAAVPSRARPRPLQLTAAEIGTAHHLFQQCVALERTGSLAELRAEAARLQATGWLTPEEVAALDWAGLAAFWHSELGRRIRAQPRRCVHREMPFTARLSAADLAGIGLSTELPVLADEFLVVQGVSDLVVLLPRQIWLVDFKTDQVSPSELADKRRLYEPQLRLYALALSRIFRRPVRELWLHFLALRQTLAVGAS